MLKTVSSWYLVFLVLISVYLLSFDLGLSEVGTRIFIVTVFALFSALISDWYYFRFSESYRGISLLILLGCIVSIVSVLTQMNYSNTSFGNLITSNSIDWAGWGRWNLQRSFQLGAAAVLIGFLGIPRLLIYEAVIKKRRKISNKIKNEITSKAGTDVARERRPF